MICAGAEAERNTSIVIWSPMRKGAPNSELQRVQQLLDESKGLSFIPWDVWVNRCLYMSIQKKNTLLTPVKDQNKNHLKNYMSKITYNLLYS